LDFTSLSMNCSMLINVHPVLRRRLPGGDSAPRHVTHYVAHLQPNPKGPGHPDRQLMGAKPAARAGMR
jgi:hypothetical protein